MTKNHLKIINRKYTEEKNRSRGIQTIYNFGWDDISDLARKIFKSKSYVDKSLRLLNLPTDILDEISCASLTPFTAEV
jgi:hypothetical protein